MRGAVLFCIVAACMIAPRPAAAQKDFLTADETAQIRDAQEPNERLRLYAVFARQRVDLVKSLLGKNNDALEDYGEIIDAIDTVADDALKRKADIKLGLAAVAKAEKEMLPILQQIQENQPKDLDRYEFSLKQAIETTSDSLSLSEGDLNARTKDVETRDEKKKKEIEGMMQPKDLEEKKAEEKKAAAEAPKKKAPTLKRKGEQ